MTPEERRERSSISAMIRTDPNNPQIPLKQQAFLASRIGTRVRELLQTDAPSLTDRQRSELADKLCEFAEHLRSGPVGGAM